MADFIDVCPWFTREGFNRYRELDPQAAHMTFDQWLSNAENAVQQMKASGVNVITVIIDPDEFVAWCQAGGHKIDAAARVQFASLVLNKRSKN